MDGPHPPDPAPAAPPTRPDAARPVRQFLQRSAVVLVIFGIFVGYAIATNRHIHPSVLFSAVLVAFMVAVLFADCVSTIGQFAWRMSPRFERVGRAFDPQFTRLAQELTDADDRRQVAVDVQARVAAIADDLLGRRHGTDRRADPERARQILGAELSEYLDKTPRDALASYAERMDPILSRLESL